MDESCIVVTRPKMTLPDKFKDMLLDKFKSGFSYSAATGGVVESMWFNAAGIDLRKQLDEVLDHYGDCNVMLHFRNMEGLKDDESPYPIIVGKGKDDIHLVAAMDGEFMGYAQEKSDKSPAWHACNDYLMDKINSLYSSCNGDMNKLFQLMEAPMFKKDVQNVVAPRGVIATMDGLGQVSFVSFKNDMALEHPAFWSSKNLGYTEVPKTVDKPAEAPAASGLPDNWDKMTFRERKMWEKEHGNATTSSPNPASVPAVQPDKKGPVDMPQPDVTPAPVVGRAAAMVGKLKVEYPPGEQVFYPPEQLRGKALRKWYPRHFGQHVSNYEERPGMPVSMLEPASGLRTTLENVGSLLGLGKTNTPAAETKIPEPVTPPAPEKEKEVRSYPDQVSMEPTTVIPPTQKKEFVDIYKAASFNSADQIMALVTKTDPASQQLGLDSVADYIRLSRSDILKVLLHKQLAFSMIMELIGELVKARPSLLEEKKKEEAPTKTLTFREQMALKKKAS